MRGLGDRNRHTRYFDILFFLLNIKRKTKQKTPLQKSMKFANTFCPHLLLDWLGLSECTRKGKVGYCNTAILEVKLCTCQILMVPGTETILQSNCSSWINMPSPKPLWKLSDHRDHLNFSLLPTSRSHWEEQHYLLNAYLIWIIFNACSLRFRLKK